MTETASSQPSDTLAGFQILAESWRRSVVTENKSPNTISVYREAVRQPGDFLADQGMQLSVNAIRRAHVETFITDLLTSFKTSTANTRYRGLQRFFA
jgi:site-specific recombinase XerD